MSYPSDISIFPCCLSLLRNDMALLVLVLIFFVYLLFSWFSSFFLCLSIRFSCDFTFVFFCYLLFSVFFVCVWRRYECASEWASLYIMNRKHKLKMNSHHKARESRIAANTLPTYHCNKTYHFEQYKKMVKQAHQKKNKHSQMKNQKMVAISKAHMKTMKFCSCAQNAQWFRSCLIQANLLGNVMRFWAVWLNMESKSCDFIAHSRLYYVTATSISLVLLSLCSAVDVNLLRFLVS